MKNKNQQLQDALIAYKKVLNLIEKHNRLFSQTINLIAGENTLSPSIMNALSSDLNNRVAEGWVGERVYPGMQYYDRIEILGIEVAKELFGCEHVDLRPISGSLANMAVFTAFTKPGDILMSLGIKEGAHISMAGRVVKDVFHLRHIPLAFDSQEMNIKIRESKVLIKKYKPKIVMLGGSVILFPQPVAEIAKIAHSVGSLVVYDAAHVAGLIAGGEFQNPFQEGADIVTLTTCKTIPGPQGGIILSKQEYANKLKQAVFPTLISGHHLHETAGAVLALLELKAFGKNYAIQTINNAKKLGSELLKKGFTVFGHQRGCTKSHTILINCSELGGGLFAEKRLESANIISNRNVVPSKIEKFTEPSGLRLGTQEVTHIGMKENDMQSIADFMFRLLILKEDSQKIRQEIIEFRSKFSTVKYCFDGKYLPKVE